jgi:hypothetical protein
MSVGARPPTDGARPAGVGSGQFLVVRRSQHSARRRHAGGLGGSDGGGEGGDSRGQDCRETRTEGAGHHCACEKTGRRRAESQRSSCARGKLEASRGQSWPRVPPCPHRGSNLWPPGRTCGLRVDRGVPSLLRYPTVAFRARPLAALVPTALACLPSMLGGWSSRADGRRRCWTAGRCEAWADAGTGGRRERRGGAKKRAAWWWRCCWPSGARVALASQLACT